MRDLSIDQLDAETERFDRAVFATPNIDTFCSSSAWVIPAHRGLMPPRTTWLKAVDELEGYIALALGPAPDGARTLQPLEAVWGLGSPFVGPEPHAVAVVCVEECLRQPDAWDALLVTGIAGGSGVGAVLVAGFARGQHYDAYLGPTTQRHVAALTGGLDGFLSRRSRNFRRSVLRARRDTQAAGIRFVDLAPAELEDTTAVYARIVAIERRSWKGREGVGIEQGPMHHFYGQMLPRLARRGWLRVMLARRDGEDVGFVVGALTGQTYRGLQFSFDVAYRPIGLGNAMQLAVIEDLAAHGVTHYDLGSHADYKHRWAETGLETLSIAIRRR